jgi:hypothetical protein
MLEAKIKDEYKTAATVGATIKAARERAKLFMLIHNRARHGTGVWSFPPDIWLEIHKHINGLTIIL